MSTLEWSLTGAGICMGIGWVGNQYVRVIMGNKPDSGKVIEGEILPEGRTTTSRG